MSIFILYESEEWSNFALNDYIKEKGINSKLINLEKQVNTKEFLNEIKQKDLIINRIFASAQFRGHKRALALAKLILDRIKKRGIESLNSGM